MLKSCVISSSAFFNKLKCANTRVTITLTLLAVFLLRLGFSFVWVTGDRTNPKLNIDGWWWLAQNVALGKGYTYYDGTPTARRGPVPVFFFAIVYKLFGENRLAVLSSLWLLDVGTAWMIFLIAEHIFKSRKVGLLAMLAFALYVPEIVYTTRAYSEPIGTFLLACLVLTLLKARQYLSLPWFTAAGIFMGLTILTRAVMLAFPAVALLIFATWPALRKSRRKFLVNALAFTVTVTAIMMPWIIRNYLTFQAFIPASTLGGYNLYLNHWRLGEADYNSPSRWDNNSWKFIDPESKAELIAQGVRFVEWNGREFPDWDEHEYDRFYYKKALAIIRQYLFRYLHLSVLRVLILWFNVGYGAPPSIQSYMVMVTNLVLLLLSAIAYFFYGGSWQKEASLLIWLLSYTTIMHALMHALVRYVMPVIPYVLILASYATIKLCQSLLKLSVAKRIGLAKVAQGPIPIVKSQGKDDE